MAATLWINPFRRLLPRLRICGKRMETVADGRAWQMTDFATRRMMMVDTQIRPSDVTKFPIIEAMLTVPREVYVPRPLREVAYMSENVAVAPNRVLLEPRTFAKLLDTLNIQPVESVLDVACGLGYSCAVIARLAEAVVGLEEDEQLAAEAQRTLSAEGVDNAAVIVGPLTSGAAKHGPYDVITVEGAVETVPQALLDQLKEGGRIGCIFMEGPLGVARIGYKVDGAITWRPVFNASAPVLPGFEVKRDFAL
ncbi:protein-L-isoaspartate(D-aspartate) O-methyltransferase [[Luteovulum] sphaeroides subsp. megalophilum]|nr:protein-L-isoaspartate(D-aspartate) O-methyltransferase [[Luteovulum] sphaeroides subsp. megalophilum]